MPDTIRGLTGFTDGTSGKFRSGTGAISAQDLRDFAVSVLYPQLLSPGRLTLTSGTPLTTSDVTAAGTVYFTPYNGNVIGLYDGTDWLAIPFTEQSISLASGFS